MDVIGFKTKDGSVHRYDYRALANRPDPDSAAVIPELDATLTQSGKAADAKAVGDAIAQCSGSNSAMAVYDRNVRGINHRGFHTVAPENTIPAYILSKKNGFSYVECDVSFTADGVCVLLHDSTIDRTSNGSGEIASMTYAQASQYDYGSWKSEKYAGTQIPTLSEFLLVCKGLGLHPYIEIKSESGTTQAMVDSIVTAVQAAGMKGKVTYISYNTTYLGWVKAMDPYARLGYVVEGIASKEISAAKALKQDTNQVFVNVNQIKLTDTMVNLCIHADLPLEVWNVNSASWIENMNPYISGVTSDSLIAGKILHDKYMAYEAGETDSEKSLNGISVTYSGGAVAVGTAVSSLTGIVVTASYSDGSNETVTGYTLSGSIEEGENTVTVSYAGKTASFPVIGVAEEGEDETEMLEYTVTNNLTRTVNSNSASTATSGESYYADLTGAEGYVLSGGYVTVKMGGHNVTAAVYSDGRIAVAAVTGNLEITAESVREAPAVPEGYEQVRNLYSNELHYGMGNQFQMPDSEPPYTVANTKRIGYYDQDIPVEFGYAYRVDFASGYEEAQYSMQLITRAGLDLMEEAGNFSAGGTPNAQVYDPGWLENGAEVTIPEHHNNSPCVCMRLSFRRSTSNETVARGDIQSVTVSRRAAAG